MKRSFLLIAPVFLFFFNSSAQDETIKKLRKESEKNIKKETADTIKKAWKKGGLYTINISQGSLKNWAAGGDDFSLSVNSALSLFIFYKKSKVSWGQYT
jgi:hypothetical protein